MGVCDKFISKLTSEQQLSCLFDICFFFFLSNRKCIGQPHSDVCELNMNLRFWFLLKSSKVYWELKQQARMLMYWQDMLLSKQKYCVHCLICDYEKKVWEGFPFWFERCWDCLKCLLYHFSMFVFFLFSAASIKSNQKAELKLKVFKNKVVKVCAYSH